VEKPAEPITPKIEYPFMPVEGVIEYVAADDPLLQAAKAYALAESLDENVPTGSVIVKDGQIIGRGANGSKYHELHGCERVRLGIPTGTQYELCEGCHPKNHSEPRAVADAIENGHDPHGATLYLWGHWWCCEPCWNAMLGAGITTVRLMEDSQTLLNRDAPGNIVGRTKPVHARAK
jgi:deoxycytidylate deaminase